MDDVQITMHNVSKKYGKDTTLVQAVSNIELQIRRGEMTVIFGQSGCGKTTLLNLLGGMDKADEGSIIADGQKLEEMSRRRLTEYRRGQVGFIFQTCNLMPNLTALQNLQYMAEIAEHPLDPLTELKRVGLFDRRSHYPAQLSGGEQQRVAIARALIKNPKLILADEPTASLDGRAGREVLGLLEEAVRKRGCTAVIVTHNKAIAPVADCIVYMRGGRIESIVRNPNPVSAAELDL